MAGCGGMQTVCVQMGEIGSLTVQQGEKVELGIEVYHTDTPDIAHLLDDLRVTVQIQAGLVLDQFIGLFVSFAEEGISPVQRGKDHDGRIGE